MAIVKQTIRRSARQGTLATVGSSTGASGSNSAPGPQTQAERKAAKQKAAADKKANAERLRLARQAARDAAKQNAAASGRQYTGGKAPPSGKSAPATGGVKKPHRHVINK